MYQNIEAELMERLKLEGILKTADVVSSLGISESTARRLFLKLENEGKALRVHGGIRYATHSVLEYSFEEVAKTDVEEKKAIADVAMAQLKDGDVVFCDSGTTLRCFCMELAERLEKNPIDIRVYTNSLANFEILTSKIPVYLIGGQFRANRRDFCGFLAEEVVSKVQFTKSFLGTDGCNFNGYFSTTDFDTARLGSLAARNSKEVFVLAASGKFSAYAHLGYLNFSEVDKIITDSGITPDVKVRLEECGMQVLTA